jgi:hypothetical protein
MVLTDVFLKSCWDIVSPELYNLCQEFAEGRVILDNINISLITLIPKKQAPTTINDYRPISLLNTCLKLLTKLLADRLQQWILDLVSPIWFYKRQNHSRLPSMGL